MKIIRISLKALLALALITVSSTAATPFINPKSFDVTKILPPPPQPGSEEYKMDTGFLKDARAASTHEQLIQGIVASHDSVFDYSQTLGSWFCSANLPESTKFFAEVTKETKGAIELAKNSFHRTRPTTWKTTGDTEKSEGYSYPSGHTTRAFVWAILLSDAFPDMKKKLHSQARQKAWYRVILGRHFPDDIHAGKVYGKFLAEQFLKSPEFQKKWPAICAEMHEARKKSSKAPLSPKPAEKKPATVSASS